ncbi:MAG: hypothetical protein ACYCW6_21250 [Candidatus Xenobia bacterium]
MRIASIFVLLTLAAAASLPSKPGAPIPGRAIGVICTDTTLQAFFGRYGQSTSVTFTTGDGTPLWVYLPGQGPALQFQDEHGGRVKPVPVHLATVPELGVYHVYSLVSATVNGGHGSRGDLEVALSDIHILDGTRGYPPDIDRLLARVKAAPIGPALDRASRIPDTARPSWYYWLQATHYTDRVLTYVTWQHDALVVHREHLAVARRTVKTGTRRIMVYPQIVHMPYDPAPGIPPPPPPPPPHWATVDKLHLIEWAASIDSTLTWRNGRVTLAIAPPALYRFERDSN